LWLSAAEFFFAARRSEPEREIQCSKKKTVSRRTLEKRGKKKGGQRRRPSPAEGRKDLSLGGKNIAPCLEIGKKRKRKRSPKEKGPHDSSPKKKKGKTTKKEKKRGSLLGKNSALGGNGPS